MEEFSFQTCPLFDEPTSDIDYFFVLLLTEFWLLQAYYSLRFPYGFIEHLIKIFPFLGFLASRNKEKKNEDTPTKIHQEKYVEPFSSIFLFSLGFNLFILMVLAYFRMDRFYIVQHTPLKYFTSHLTQLSNVILCSGDITFIPRDSSIAFFLRILGLVIIQCGAILFVWAHQEMKASWTPLIHLKKDHKLITSGPFQIVRHPMYFSVFLLAIGISLVSWNWFIAISSLVWFFSALFRIPLEEKLMLDTYGMEYQKYRSTVKYAVIPCVY